MGPAVAAPTIEIDLPTQTTLDQAIVALLQLRRGQVPGDATLDQPVVLRFEYTTTDEATPEVPPPEDITPRSRRLAHARSRPGSTAGAAALPDPAS
jgi:hypothetical protein